MRHRKFARLARLVGSEVLARGHLELLWEVAYENGDDLVGDEGDLEHLARWSGPAGALAAALVESGFFDLADGQYRVHDLWDHAPDYVRKRRSREAERKTKGAVLESVTGQRPPPGAEGSRPAPNGRTRAPAPSHIKTAAAERASAREAAAPPAAVEPLPVAAPAVTPPPPPPAVEPEEPVRRRPLLIEDRSVLGPLGAEYRALVERELEHGLAGPKRGDAGLREELEQLLARHGVERAANWTVNTALARRRAGAAAPGSVAWCAALVRSMPEPRPNPLEAVRAGCAEWARVLEAILGLQRLRPDQVERWLLPLEASFDDQVLLLRAPEELHRSFVEEFYLEGLQRLAGEALGFGVSVVLEGPPEAAAGGG
jgi:hypothetical protein